MALSFLSTERPLTVTSLLISGLFLLPSANGEGPFHLFTKNLRGEKLVVEAYSADDGTCGSSFDDKVYTFSEGGYTDINCDNNCKIYIWKFRENDSPWDFGNSRSCGQQAGTQGCLLDSDKYLSTKRGKHYVYDYSTKTICLAATDTHDGSGTPYRDLETNEWYCEDACDSETPTIAKAERDFHTVVWWDDEDDYYLSETNFDFLENDEFVEYPASIDIDRTNLDSGAYIARKSDRTISYIPKKGVLGRDVVSYSLTMYDGTVVEADIIVTILGPAKLTADSYTLGSADELGSEVTIDVLGNDRVNDGVVFLKATASDESLFEEVKKTEDRKVRFKLKDDPSLFSEDTEVTITYKVLDPYSGTISSKIVLDLSVLFPPPGPEACLARDDTLVVKHGETGTIDLALNDDLPVPDGLWHRGGEMCQTLGSHVRVDGTVLTWTSDPDKPTGSCTITYVYYGHGCGQATVFISSVDDNDRRRGLGDEKPLLRGVPATR